MREAGMDADMTVREQAHRVQLLVPPSSETAADLDREAYELARSEGRRVAGRRFTRSRPATVDVVVVTYDSRPDLERCFASVERAAERIGARILVVDNGSTDGSLEFCLGRPAGLVEGVSLMQNRGYATAVNAAAACSSADYLIVLNPDIQCPEGDELERLVNHLETHPAAAAAAPMLRNVDGSVQSSARVVPSLSMLAARQTPFGRTPGGRRRAERYLAAPTVDGEFCCIEWAIGAALAIRRKDWDRVGGWDGNFFLYFEDVDFCTRLRHSGRQVHYVPGVQMTHDHHRRSDRAHGSALSSRARRAHIHSALRFFRKHPGCILRRLSDDGRYVPTVADGLRRVIDVAVAGSLLLLLGPLMLAIALLVRRDSAGPALFAQRRLGKSGREFTMYKFRTMRAGADTEPHAQFVEKMIREGHGGTDGEGRPVFKIHPDERVTRVGEWLRRWSLDELPQLWNVLRGEMTLVGFRPPIPYELEHYPAWYYGRFDVKPGMTGLWQVSGRNERSYEEMVLFDLAYIQRRSLRLDMTLLARTAMAVASRRGAL